MLNRLREDHAAAEASGDTVKANLLSSLIPAVEAVGQNDGGRETTDAEAQIVIRQRITYSEDAVQSGEGWEGIDQEIEILYSYLPPEIDHDTIHAEIGTVINVANLPRQQSSLKAIKDALQAKYPGQFDERTFAAIVYRYVAVNRPK